MTDDIKSWLDKAGLGQYAQSFAENDIDVDILAELEDADLKELGVSLGHRKKLLKALRDTGSDTPAEQPGGDAERRQLTVMFCDLVGSTKLSVRMDPEELREVISLFQKRCATVAQSFGGHVARYMGDGLLVYFGYPRAHENDPESAIYAGLETIKAVGELVVDNGIQLQTRIGIATGEVVVGDLIGAGSARERSVIGETPNLAARLQNLAEPDQAVVGDVTRKLVRGLFEFHNLGQHSLKGFDKAVTAWRVGPKSTVESRFDATHTVEQLTPLVSRDREADKLMERWSMVLSGTGQAVLVTGEAGIGKSRLVHMLRQQLAPVPHNLLKYFCASHFQHTALFPMIRQIEGVAGFSRGETNAAKLDKIEALIEQGNNQPSELAPYLAALLSIPTEDRYPAQNLSPQRWLEKTLQALELQLSGLAKDLPVLVIFEDLHWIDPTTRELLKRAVDKIKDMAVLLVMTARADFESPWQDNQNVSNLRLGRLDHDNSARLALQVSKGKKLPTEVVDLIVQKTDGIPLFIEELAKMILESDLLEERGDSLVLTGRLPDMALPNTLQDLLMARLDRQAGAKDLAQIGATIGRRFTHELLSMVSELRADQVNSGILKLISADILSAKGTAPNVVYTFKHALIQDSAYSSLLREKRKDLHLSIAHALEQKPQSVTTVRPETLAHHYTRAEEFESAITNWHEAAKLATERAAHLDAIDHANEAIELVARLPDGPQKNKTEIGLRVTLGRNQESVFGYAAPQVEQTFARARELCELQEEAVDMVPVLLGMCVNSLARGDCNTTRELAAQCVQVSKEGGHVHYLLDSYPLLNFSLSFLGRLVEAQEIAETCIAQYEEHGGKKFESVTANNPNVAVRSQSTLVLWQLGYPDRSMASLNAAISASEELEHPSNFAQIYTFATALYQLRGEYDKAVEMAQLCIQTSSEHGYDYWALLCTLHLGIAMGAQGETEEGLAYATQALNVLGAAGADLNVTYFLGGVGQIHRVAGDADKGILVLTQAIEKAIEMEELLYLDWLHILRGECYLELDEPDYESADVDFVYAIEVATGQEARMMQLRATIRLYRLRDLQGNASAMRDELRAAVEAIEGGSDTLDVIDARALLAESV